MAQEQVNEIRCQTCGKPMAPARKRGASKQYCSDGCRSAAWRLAKQGQLRDRVSRLEERLADVEERLTEHHSLLLPLDNSS